MMFTTTIVKIKMMLNIVKRNLQSPEETLLVLEFVGLLKRLLMMIWITLLRAVVTRCTVKPMELLAINAGVLCLLITWPDWLQAWPAVDCLCLIIVLKVLLMDSLTIIINILTPSSSQNMCTSGAKLLKVQILFSYIYCIFSSLELVNKWFN